MPYQLWIIRLSYVLLLALTLAFPAWAQVRPPTLSDSQEPGSVLVFPKFLTGKTGEGQPKSEFVIGITCPKNPDGTPGVCAEGTKVELAAFWTCHGSQDPAEKFICKVTDFNLTSTVFGTIVINPANVGPVTQRVPGPSCAAGYLVVSVVNTSDQPIKFDGLVGHAVLREVDEATAAYNAIPIEAAAALATNAVLPPAPATTSAYNGAIYQTVTGQVQGTVAYDQLTGTPGSMTALTLLTLDFFENRPNNPTFVDLNFYSDNEVLLSTSHEFICWTQVALSVLNSGLTARGLSPKGLLVSAPAENVALGGITDAFVGPVTLLGLVETVTWDGSVQAYSYALYNNSVPVIAATTPTAP